MNAADLRTGWGGNRILFALTAPAGPGFDLVQLDDGALQLGVNQWPDGSPARSSAGHITEDAGLGTANWIFFAVTYDGTQPAGNVSFYFGSGDQAVQLDTTVDYDRGPILQSGAMTIGNFGTVVAARNETGPTGGSRCFRGLIDEINVFNKLLTLAEIQQVQKAPATAVAVSSPPITWSRVGNQIVLTWDSSANFQLHYRDTLTTGTWTDEPTAPTINGARRSVTLPMTAQARFYRLINR